MKLKRKIAETGYILLWLLGIPISDFVADLLAAPVHVNLGSK